MDYSVDHEGGVFPLRVESCVDKQVASWLEWVIHIIPVAARPDGYETLEEMHLLPEWVSRLERTGRDCYRAIVSMDLNGLADAVNVGMVCWEAILPTTTRHPALTADWPALIWRIPKPWCRLVTRTIP